MPAPESPEEAEEQSLLVCRALALVSTDFEPATLRAFQLTALEGRTAGEAAEALGVTVNSVYLAKSRVLRRLRKEIDPPPN